MAEAMPSLAHWSAVSMGSSGSGVGVFSGGASGSSASGLSWPPSGSAAGLSSEKTVQSGPEGCPAPPSAAIARGARSRAAANARVKSRIFRFIAVSTSLQVVFAIRKIFQFIFSQPI